MWKVSTERAHLSSDPTYPDWPGVNGSILTDLARSGRRISKKRRRNAAVLDAAAADQPIKIENTVSRAQIQKEINFSNGAFFRTTINRKRKGHERHVRNGDANPFFSYGSLRIRNQLISDVL